MSCMALWATARQKSLVASRIRIRATFGVWAV